MLKNIKNYIIENTDILQFAQEELNKRLNNINQNKSDANSYNIEKHKLELEDEIKNNPEIIQDIKNKIQDEELNESVVAKLKDYKINGQTFKKTFPGDNAKNIVGNGSMLSKVGLSNTDMGTKQVLNHNNKVASGLVTEATDNWKGGRTHQYEYEKKAKQKEINNINKAAVQANKNSPSILLKTQPTHHRKPGHDILHQISLNKG